MRRVGRWSGRVWRRVAGLVDPVTGGWAVVLSGTVVRHLFGLVAGVLIARALGPSAFGVYAVLGAAAGIAGVVADFGLSATAVKRIAEVSRDDGSEQDGHAELRWRAYTWLRLAVTAAVVSGLVALAWPLGTGLLDLPREATGLVQLAFLGVLATAVSGVVATALQARRRFGRLSVVLVTNSALTAALAVVLALIGRLDLVTVLLVLGIGTSLATAVVGVPLLPSGWRLAPPPVRQVRHEGVELFRFGRWLWLGGLLAMLAMQLDVLLLNRLATPAAVGAYALAVGLAAKVDVVNQSLHTVMLPTASGLRPGPELRAYIRRSLARSAVVALALPLLIPLARPLITLLYGSDYAASVPLFQALVLVAMLDVVATPLLLLAFPLDRARLLAAADAARVVVTAGVAVALIPRYGPMGAVAARAAAHAAGAALVLVGLRRDLRSASVS